MGIASILEAMKGHYIGFCVCDIVLYIDQHIAEMVHRLIILGDQPFDNKFDKSFRTPIIYHSVIVFGTRPIDTLQ